MIIKEIHDKTIAHFSQLGIASARLDADLLLSRALGLKRIELYTKFESPLTEEELSACREMVKRRSKLEPIAYILEKKSFYQDDFYVDAGVLIPRPETELIIDVAKKKCDPEIKKIIDLGCGSGCLGLSLLREFSKAQLTAVDVSEKAINVTKRNAASLGLSERTSVLQKDLYSESLDISPIANMLVVSNPPYIDKEDPNLMPEVKQFEPEEALIAEDNGLAAYKIWLPKVIELAPIDMPFIFEFGWQQRQQLEKILANYKIKDLEFFKDLAGHDRVFYFRKA